MSESRKIHQSDGEQPKDNEHVALDVDKEFRTSRLSLSKDKASPDGAHEKLLQKEDEAKIVRDMRVDIVDAKFVSGDHRNGDPKIELDANKKQFSGLTKEELMKYADDPFWVNLRWFMFVLFWALWLGMLAGAITIIIRAPKCAPPTPKTWFEKGPLVELDSQDYADVEAELPLLQSSKVEGIFIQVPTYDALDKPDVLIKFKAFVEKAKEYSIRVIVDLTPNFVSANHTWFKQSENRTAPFTDYFVWADSKEFDSADKPKPPNNWISTLNTSAWTWSDTRKAFYLHQFESDQPDLDFNNQEVVKQFRNTLGKWMGAGAGGVRLNKARLMLVDTSLAAELPNTGRGSIPGLGHSEYAYYRHTHTADLLALDPLLTDYMAAVDAATPADTEPAVFTLKEEASPEMLVLKRFEAIKLRPPSAAPIPVTNATEAADVIKMRIKNNWPIIQLKGDEDAEKELAYFALLLPATPVFDIKQLSNETSSESLSHLTALRADASVEHGEIDESVAAVRGRSDADNATHTLLACARWKAGHTGYVAVFNPSADPLRANLTTFSSIPETLTVHHVSHEVRAYTNYTNNYSEQADNILVPGKSTVVLSYVPTTTAEN